MRIPITHLLAVAMSSCVAWTSMAVASPVTSPADAFAQAKREHRFVILDLEAVWCHWCHVMDRDTYGNEKEQQAIGNHFVLLKLDQDANPDFAARYGDWGWPATIVFAEDGSEIVKRRGFIEPQRFVALLDAIVADPSPGPSVVDAAAIVAQDTAALDAASRTRRMSDVHALFDKPHAGWGDGQRYLDVASIEWTLEDAHGRDNGAESMARQTLDANLHLIDPVWGGVYQYSIGPGWHDPHFEKIMSFQADDLRLYALAYARWKDPRYLDAAHAIERYLTTFLISPQGAFYVSQDADLSATVDGHAYFALDDSGRRALGMPRIDTHVYTRENAWAIAALCQVHDSLGDSYALEVARRATRWILDHRRIAGGGFRHDERDVAGPYLADNVAMAGALLALYRSTGEREWLTHAEATLGFIEARLHSPDAGYLSSPLAKNAVGALAQPLRQQDENIELARVANLAWRSTANPRDRRTSEHAARFAFAWGEANPQRYQPSLLLLDRERASEPLHVAVVGARDNATVAAMHAAALAYPALYRRIDLWDPREGPLPNPDVVYPRLSRPAAFVCTGNACSPPVYAATDIAVAVDRISEITSTPR
ncbi:MAG: DUF255 domain-containing protein [Dokdonella sp.]|uniref:DUF255 domain-containing protein n=1 Tax=Dokdonella sp. TaxID=2291710 RepID=UPI003263C603